MKRIIILLLTLASVLVLAPTQVLAADKPQTPAQVQVLPASVSGLGDTCAQATVQTSPETHIIKWCMGVDEALVGTPPLWSVRYRSHPYCIGMRCNFDDAAAELRYCNNNPPDCAAGTSLGLRNFPGVLNATEATFIGSWHAENSGSYMANSNSLLFRDLETNILWEITVACSRWIQFSTGVTDPAPCP